MPTEFIVSLAVTTFNIIKLIIQILSQLLGKILNGDLVIAAMKKYFQYHLNKL